MVKKYTKEYFKKQGMLGMEKAQKMYTREQYVLWGKKGLEAKKLKRKVINSPLLAQS